LAGTGGCLHFIVAAGRRHIAACCHGPQGGALAGLLSVAYLYF
jgi:hypothetical protein